MNLKNKKLDIIVVAGQSNAEGNGLLEDVSKRIVFDDQYEMVDANKYYFDSTNPNDVRLVLTMPIETKIRNLQERITDDNKYCSDLSISFVQKYINAGYLKEDRKILVVKAAVGGTGFTKKQQGVGNVLFERLIQMVDLALSYNKENKIVAFLWHQGEHDAYENMGKDPQYIYDFYKAAFLRQTQAFINRYKQFSFPVITGGFCPSWRNLKENIVACDKVEQALKDSCKLLDKADFVKVNDLKSNAEIINNGDGIHFCRESLFILGERYFDSWVKLK